MALSERIEKNVDLGYYEGQIPVNYVYTYGLGLEKFFRAIMERGEMLACCCPECDTVYFPCRIFCERCFTRIDESFSVPGTGTLYSYTVCHLGADGSPLEKPRVIALVEMDGAPGGVFMHQLKGEPGAIAIGMKVKAVLKSRKERAGGLFDIEYFEQA